MHQNEGHQQDGVHDDRQAEQDGLVDLEQAGGQTQLGNLTVVIATGDHKDGQDKAKGGTGAAEEDEGVGDRFGPEVELFACLQRRFNRAVLVVEGDVFQGEGEQNAGFQRGERQHAVYPEEPEEGGEHHVDPADQTAHIGQRLGDAVHDQLVEVGARIAQQIGDDPHDGEDDKARNERGERAGDRGRHAVRQGDHPVATDDKGEHLGHDDTDQHAGNDVGSAQPVGAHRIGVAHAERRDRHKGRNREQARCQGIALALFGQRQTDKEGGHQGHDPQSAVIDVATDAFEAVQSGDGGRIEPHTDGVEEGSFAKAQEHVVDQYEHGPDQCQGHHLDKAVLDSVDMRLFAQLDGNGQYDLLQRCDDVAHRDLLTYARLFLMAATAAFSTPSPSTLP